MDQTKKFIYMLGMGLSIGIEKKGLEKVDVGGLWRHKKRHIRMGGRFEVRAQLGWLSVGRSA